MVASLHTHASGSRNDRAGEPISAPVMDTADGRRISREPRRGMGLDETRAGRSGLLIRPAAEINGAMLR
jgi:hypothetical protein